MERKNSKKGDKGDIKGNLKRLEGEVKKAVEDGYELSGFWSPAVESIDNGVGLSMQNVARSLDLGDTYKDNNTRAGARGVQVFGGDIGITTELFGQQYMVPTPVSGCGSEGMGYVPWGVGNRLPREIYRLAGSLPYTASALRYLTDLACGLGPKLMYHYTRYSGQTVTDKLIPYESAGVLLRNLIAELRAKKEEEERGEDLESGADGEDLGVLKDPHTYIYPAGEASRRELSSDAKYAGADGIKDYRTKQEVAVAEEPLDVKKVGTLDDELERLEHDYEMWDKTMREYKKFEEDNNLELHYQQCCMDDMHMDMYFPTIGLSQGVPGKWEPKIVKIGYLPAICTRLEEMDEDLRINYVYYSEKWRREGVLDNPQKNDIVAYPTLMPNERLPRLRAVVKANQKTALKSRPTWFCCPNHYPSGSRAYYQIPAWWSIFTSLVYSYASTLVTDKAIARKNATMWGKLIFINLNYLKAVADSMGVSTPKEMQELKDKIVSSINDFLRRRENNGKTCALESMVGPDGKTLVDSVRIVDVPQVSSGSETKTELEEISSIIFFALGVHPALVGAIPGKSGSSGGTFQRELHLLKQNQMTPRQRIYLRWLNDIVKFNGWDEHAKYVIEMPVLTTLDRNATGIETTSTEG